MPEPQTPDPVAQNADPAASSPDELLADPLVGSDSFIDPNQVEPEATLPEEEPKEQEPEQEQEEEHVPNVGFDPGMPIAAQPISMLRPGEEPVRVEKTPRRKSMEEMSVRPSWLPDDWTMSLRVRASGNSAGIIDPYYSDPTGQHKFRSKNEVLHFLETGSKKKKRLASGTAAGPSSDGPEKQNRSGKKGKKSKDGNSEAANASNGGADADASG